ncbi:MAG: antibiotic biosynthesis monooxygenase [Acidimicrobiales bacterium]
MADSQCTAIVAYEVNGEDCERFLEAWDQAKAYLQEQQGFVTTSLHQSCSAMPDFRFVAISCWETEDAFRAATQNTGFQEARGRLEAYPVHASVYEVVRS